MCILFYNGGIIPGGLSRIWWRNIYFTKNEWRNVEVFCFLRNDVIPETFNEKTRDFLFQQFESEISQKEE